MMVTASDGSDCSRDSAKNIIENDAIIVTALNQPEINTNIMNKVQDTTLEAVTSAETRDNAIDTRTSLPTGIASSTNKVRNNSKCRRNLQVWC